MARPVVSDATEKLYGALDAFALLDEGEGWALLKFCAALVSSPVDQIHGYVTDTDDGPGWQIVLDPENAPPEVLDWLAQFVGTIITPSMDEAAKRSAILLPRGFQRGTLAGLTQAVAATLTGSQTVLVTERNDRSDLGTDMPYRLSVRTITTETPSQALTLAAILTQKPIGVQLTYEAITVWDWGDLQAAEATWADVQADFDTWLDARTQLP